MKAEAAIRDSWGLPDWRQPASYGDTDPWPRNRWRWEFTRRRDDYRTDFLQSADNTFAHCQELYADSESLVRLLKPNEPGFCAIATVEQCLKYGMPALPNPKIAEQPAQVLSFQPRFPSSYEFLEGKLPEWGARIEFDLDEPLARQLEQAKSWLEAWQSRRHGRAVQRRQHPERWLLFLRALDARECGATYADMCEVFWPGRQNSGGAARKTAQSARDIHKQAIELRANFPS